MTQTKGFTLIELLMVLGIIAVLSVVVILTLNPAELARQSRDSTRLADMATLNNALGLYLTSVTPPTLGVAATCYVSASSTSAQCGGLFSAGYTLTSATTSVAVDGTGWIPVNFTSMSSGAPFGSLPRDPVNSATYYYAYAPSSTTFELNANMESSKYRNGGSKDIESTDGGNNVNWFETGTSPGLSL